MVSLIDDTLTGTASPGQSETVGNDNKKIHHILLVWSLNIRFVLCYIEDTFLVEVISHCSYKLGEVYCPL